MKKNEIIDKISKCSRCGLCKSVCPVHAEYISELFFLRGKILVAEKYLRGDAKLFEALETAVFSCNQCGKCKAFCPSGIDWLDIRSGLLSEYFLNHNLSKVNYEFEKIPEISLKNSIKLDAKFKNKKIYFHKGCRENIDTDILKNIFKDVIFVEHEDLCCGGALDFKENYPDIFNKINRKLKDNIILSSADIIVTSCPVCFKNLKSSNLQKEVYLLQDLIKN